LVDDTVVATGTDMLLTVITDTDSSSSTYGLATGYGSVILNGTLGDPFFEEVASLSPMRRLDLMIQEFRPLGYCDEDDLLHCEVYFEARVFLTVRGVDGAVLLETNSSILGAGGGDLTTGTPSFADLVDAEISVPTGALDTETTISITEYSTTDPALPPPPANSLSRVIRFGPAGLTFNSPVTIVLSYHDDELVGKAEASLQAHLLLGEDYVTVPECLDPAAPTPDPCVSERDPNANTITVVTTHFTVYALSAEPSEVEIKARDLKEGVRNNLLAYKGESKRFKKAIKEIEQSLTPKYWIDDLYLDSKHGHRVFSEGRHAVKELMHLLKGGKKDHVSDEALAAARMGIDDLVQADRILSLTLLSETEDLAAVDPSRQEKVDKAIAKAQEEFDKGDARRDAGKPDKAIQHYRKAWERTQHAVKEAAKDKGKGKK
jgi:hypothetical protein